MMACVWEEDEVLSTACNKWGGRERDEQRELCEESISPASPSVRCRNMNISKTCAQHQEVVQDRIRGRFACVTVCVLSLRVSRLRLLA